MVGHTHEDIDALFGHVSNYLRKHDAITVAGQSLIWSIDNFHTTQFYTNCNNYTFSLDFLHGLTAAKGDYSKTHVFDTMFDVKSWLSPHIKPLHNHSRPHIFRFYKAADNSVYMQYKQWRHSQWEPKSSNGILLLKVWHVKLWNYCVKYWNIVHWQCASLASPFRVSYRNFGQGGGA